jgi:hypothetical protein
LMNLAVSSPSAVISLIMSNLLSCYRNPEGIRGEDSNAVNSSHRRSG